MFFKGCQLKIGNNKYLKIIDRSYKVNVFSLFSRTYIKSHITEVKTHTLIDSEQGNMSICPLFKKKSKGNCVSLRIFFL